MSPRELSPVVRVSRGDARDAESNPNSCVQRDDDSRFEVVVCGGGIAGVEGLLRLRRLADDRMRLTLISPDPVLVYRPAAVRAQFAGSCLRRYSLERICADNDVHWLRDGLSRVDHEDRRVHTERGLTLRYDALLLAIGARESPPYAHACTFTGRDADETVRGIVQGVETGSVTSVAFVLPHEWVWPLPLYELALMTAERAQAMSVQPQIIFITAEGRPLKAFGQAAGEAVRELFEKAGIRLHTGVVAQVPAPGVIRLDGTQLEAEQIVTLPKITGPAIAGIPAGPAGLSRSMTGASCPPPTDGCSPPGTPRIFRSSRAESVPSKLTPPQRA